MICGCNNSNRIENKNINKILTINDTFKLSAYFDECGEFGGHREQIKIYNIRDTISISALEVLGADFLIDTMTCHSKKKRVFKKVKTKTLTDNDKILILD